MRTFNLSTFFLSLIGLFTTQIAASPVLEVLEARQNTASSSSSTVSSTASMTSSAAAQTGSGYPAGNGVGSSGSGEGSSGQNTQNAAAAGFGNPVTVSGTLGVLGVGMLLAL